MAISHKLTMANSRYCVNRGMMAFSLHLWISGKWLVSMAKEPIQPQDKYVLRMPDGMRDRIKKSAERSGRSMNAEIVQALETIFPPEPTMEQVLDRIHTAIDQVNNSNLPYRPALLDALDTLAEQLSSGIEVDQYRQRLPPKGMEGWSGVAERMRRWRRVQEYGVELEDLKRELERGLLKNTAGSTASEAIQAFKAGNPDRALGMLRLSEIKFAEPDASHRAIDAWLRSFYEENWGDPDEPWQYGE